MQMLKTVLAYVSVKTVLTQTQWLGEAQQHFSMERLQMQLFSTVLKQKSHLSSFLMNSWTKLYLVWVSVFFISSLSCAVTSFTQICYENSRS